MHGWHKLRSLMTRILILIVLGFIVFKLVKRILANAESKPSAKQPKPLAEEKMIQCSQCGCHVPISESISKNNQLICNNPECNQ